MKKIKFLLTLVLVITMISAERLSAQNEGVEKNAKPAAAKDSKGINKPHVTESNVTGESLEKKSTDESEPGILFLLSKDPGQVVWSPSLWWSYKHSKTGQPGC
jgi:hypothetical protein